MISTSTRRWRAYSYLGWEQEYFLVDEDLYAARPDLMLTGKHNNWSLGTDTGTLLLAPGKDAKGNLQFVTFFVNVQEKGLKIPNYLRIHSAHRAHHISLTQRIILRALSACYFALSAHL